MGEEGGGGDKTEEPTPHRLKQARDKGQIAKSKEITTAFLLLSSYMLLRYTAEGIWRELSQMMQLIFRQIPNAYEFDIPFIVNIFVIAGRALLLALAPLFGVTFLIAFLAEALQTGFVGSLDPLSPKFEKINPLEGLKKMVSMQGLVELLKSILKIAIVFWITWAATKDDLPYVISLINSEPFQSLAIGGGIAYKIAIRVGIFYIIIAVLDYLYKRWEYMKGLKMTKQEIKEEYKQLEGDPQIKQRIRDLQRQVAQNRMMSSVPGADVVVTNPVHLAVALVYDASKMKAPTLLAKGQYLVAQEIKKIAERHQIPVIENPPLARAIFQTTKVGKEIPPEIYQAVAEVLAFVYKIKKDKKKKNNFTAGRFQPAGKNLAGSRK